jgi:hypothetical protein
MTAKKLQVSIHRAAGRRLGDRPLDEQKKVKYRCECFRVTVNKSKK